MIRRVCQYCDRTIGWKEGGDGVSHGSCAHCHGVVLEMFREGKNCDPDEVREVADLRLPVGVPACMRRAGL